METVNLNNYEEVLAWLEKKSGEGFPAVTTEDEGKTGTIQNSRLVETKYGQRLVLDIDFDGEIKSCFLSKTFAREFQKYAGTPDTWKGKKVKISLIPVMNPSKKEFVRKPFPNPIPEKGI